MLTVGDARKRLLRGVWIEWIENCLGAAIRASVSDIIVRDTVAKTT